jgi:hypothetical protein
MMDYSLDEILAWLNAERKYLGFRDSLETIPKGKLGGMIACSCPVSIGLSSHPGPDPMNTIVDGTRYWPEDADAHDNEQAMDLPEKVRAFLTDWDSGHYPELVIT